MFVTCEYINCEKDFKSLRSFSIHFCPAYNLQRLSTRRNEDDKPSKYVFYIHALTPVTTSIDAMVVRASLAFMDANILITATAIGLATFTMVTIGVMLGDIRLNVGEALRSDWSGFLLITIVLTFFMSNLARELIKLSKF